MVHKAVFAWQAARRDEKKEKEVNTTTTTTVTTGDKNGGKKRSKRKNQKRKKMEAQATNERNKENVMKKRKRRRRRRHLLLDNSYPSPPHWRPPGGPTLHKQFVLPLTLPDAVVHLAEVDAVVGFVEHLEAQVGAIRLGQWGELSVLLPPVVDGRPEREGGVVTVSDHKLSKVG